MKRRTFHPACEALEDRSVPAVFVVAVGGSDAGPGTVDAPFATIQRGLNAVTTVYGVFRPTAKTFFEPRMMRVPSEIAGVAMTTSFIELVASNSNVGPARTTERDLAETALLNQRIPSTSSVVIKDPERFALNLARMIEEAGKAAAAWAASTCGTASACTTWIRAA